MALTGDTVRLKVHFKNLIGIPINPTNVALRVYKERSTLLETITDGIEQASDGVYYYDYILPDEEQELIFEFGGLYDNKPVLARGKVNSKFY